MSKNSFYLSSSISNTMNNLILSNKFDRETMIYFHTSEMPPFDYLRTENYMDGWAIKTSANELLNPSHDQRYWTDNIDGMNFTHWPNDGTIRIDYYLEDTETVAIERYQENERTYTRNSLGRLVLDPLLFTPTLNKPVETSLFTCNMVKLENDIQLNITINGGDFLGKNVIDDNGDFSSFEVFDGIIIDGLNIVHIPEIRECVVLSNTNSNGSYVHFDTRNDRIMINLLETEVTLEQPIDISMRLPFTKGTFVHNRLLGTEIKWFEMVCNDFSIFGEVCDVEDLSNNRVRDIVLEESDIFIEPSPRLTRFTDFDILEF